MHFSGDLSSVVVSHIRAGRCCQPPQQRSGIALCPSGELLHTGLPLFRGFAFPRVLKHQWQACHGTIWGRSTHVIKTAHSPSRQISFSKALSQISPTCFSLILPVVVDSEVKSWYQFYTGNRSINLLKHFIHFLAEYVCILEINLTFLKRKTY